MEHQDEFVRYWTVRLLGDRYPPARYSTSTRQPQPLPAAIQKKLEALARQEPDAQVRTQVASAAKRLPGVNALPILREALYRAEDANDKHLPLLLWWALESKAVSDRAQLLDLLRESSLWRTPLFSKFIVSRLGQRYTAERTDENLETAAQLLAMAPAPEFVDELVKGMEAGLARAIASRAFRRHCKSRSRRSGARARTRPPCQLRAAARSSAGGRSRRAGAR